MKLSNRFRAAKELVRDNRSICDALDFSECDADGKARYIIAERLQPSTTYGHWLQVNHPEAHKRYYRNSEAFVQARLQWLDALIAEFEAKGE